MDQKKSPYDFSKYYRLPDSNQWQGRADSPPNSSFFQIVKFHDFSNTFPVVNSAKKNFSLLGFCCDEGVRRNLGRVGAAEGPIILRQTIAKLPIHSSNFDLYDFGDIICNNGNLEEAQSALGDAVNLLIQNQFTPIIVGGGHEVAWGHYQGIAKSTSKKIGIVNFDAHLDMRPLLPNHQGSSGTPFLQIADHCEKYNRLFHYYCIGVQKTGNTQMLFDTAKEKNVRMIFAEELHLKNLENSNCVSFFDDIIQNNKVLYITICLDVFSHFYAPGVSAPQPLGLFPWQVIPLLRKLINSGKVMSFDIAEFNPHYDNDHHTAKLAANLIYEITHSENIAKEII